MHWLAQRVAAIAAAAPDPGLTDGGARRRAFLSEIAELVDQAANRDGLDAVFASYDGLLVAAAGRLQAEAEPLAAFAQSTMDPIHLGTLGPLQQLLLVGMERKLALVRVGPVTIGLLSPSEVRLANATA